MAQGPGVQLCLCIGQFQIGLAGSTDIMPDLSSWAIAGRLDAVDLSLCLDHASCAGKATRHPKAVKAARWHLPAQGTQQGYLDININSLSLQLICTQINRC